MMVTSVSTGLQPWNPDGYLIRISEHVLAAMCLSGLEAYAVREKGQQGGRTLLETYGLLWGHEATLADGRTLYSVEFMSIDTSARRERCGVEPADAALTLKRDLMTSFWPHYDFLGNFHTHPHTHGYKNITEQKLYQFSEQDFLTIICHSDHWTRHNYRVGLVMTITLLDKKSSRDDRVLGDGTIEFTLGNYRLWLKGRVAHLDEDEEEIQLAEEQEVVLLCPSITGLYELTTFGRGRKGRSVRHECGRL
jgi:hypothetical protein